jgi:predicted negative regulator of RcsB-dependent stress response
MGKSFHWVSGHWILFLQQNYTEAEVWLKKALDHGGQNSGVILEHYGDVLFHLNRKDDAVSYWKKAQETGGCSSKIDLKITDKKFHE